MAELRAYYNSLPLRSESEAQDSDGFIPDSVMPLNAEAEQYMRRVEQ